MTMQLARSFWLEQDKNFNRKIAEVFLTMELERRFTKEQILEFYANEVYLGRRGSFSIHGFGEAARAYFGKDIREAHLTRVGHAGRQSFRGRATTIRSVIPSE